MDTSRHSTSLYTTKISIDDGQFVGTLKMRPKEFVIVARRPDEIDGERCYSWLYKQIADTLISVDMSTILFLRVVNKQPSQEQMLKLAFNNQFERKCFAKRFQLLSRLYKGDVKVTKTVSTQPTECEASSHWSSNPVNCIPVINHQSDQPKGAEMKQLIGTKHCLDIDCPRIPSPKPVSDRSLLSPLDGTPPKKDQVKFFPTSRGEVVLPISRYLMNRSIETKPKKILESEMRPSRALLALAARTTGLEGMEKGTEEPDQSSTRPPEEKGSVSPVSLNSVDLNVNKPTRTLRNSFLNSSPESSNSKLLDTNNLGTKDELISMNNLAKLAGSKASNQKDEILSMNNLTKLAGPKNPGDLQPSTSKVCSPISHGSSAYDKSTTIDDMLSKENLKKLAKSKENVDQPSAQKFTLPLKISNGDLGEHMTLQAEVNVTLNLHIDLAAAIEASKIKNHDELVEKIQQSIKFEASMCDLTFA